ncbi:MAG: hypothetical protein LBM93_10855 [Oscillospiraceae bacterium]|jgi:cytochrome c-type biogenesis protein CcmH/NrfG|nr:hypothetical protein [Oscillospiraceae bacterium]
MDINEMLLNFGSNSKATNNYNKGKFEFELLLEQIRKAENLTEEQKEEKINELTLRRETMLQKEQSDFETGQKRIKRVIGTVLAIIVVCVVVLLVL